VTFRANSEIGETTVANASGVFHREASITIDHAFRRWLIGSAGISYASDDYRGSGLREDRFGLQAGFTYHMNRFAALKGEVRREHLRSTAAGCGLYGACFHAGAAAAALSSWGRRQEFVKTPTG
jgi:hypothetical protein